jgi:hypothetical protein
MEVAPSLRLVQWPLLWALAGSPKPVRSFVAHGFGIDSYQREGQVKRRKEAALRAGIMRTVAALQAAQPQPDAWLKLVLQSMSAEELRRELADCPSLSDNERRWMNDELRKKEQSQ